MSTPQKDCVRLTVEVKLLQGDETFEVIPESHFTVSRTAHRNNSSDYYIDEKKSNFTEVTKLLKKKGIDLDNNRFLILQVSCVSKRAQSHCIHESFTATPASAVYLFSAMGIPAFCAGQLWCRCCAVRSADASYADSHKTPHASSLLATCAKHSQLTSMTELVLHGFRVRLSRSQ